MESTLQHIIDSNLQWIFVGGKGGVGKTTTSCALATLLATTPRSSDGKRRRVLLVSTDPAHNLSDAFNQQMGSTPTPVKGLEDSLAAMEIDPTTVTRGALSFLSTTNDASANSPFAALASIVKEAASSLPGIDEVSVFAEILHGVQKLNYDVVLFDTAPTGHTLRLLSLPHTLNTTLDKLLNLDGIAPLINAATSMFGSASTNSTALNTAAGAGDAEASTQPSFMSSLASWKEQVHEVQQQFCNSEKTAFVCVCIPEFLSVYETERLVQELMKYDIGCDSIVVNQLVLKPSTEPPCRMCTSRQRVQGKYLAQIDSLYEDFAVVKMPLMSEEVRGVAALTSFARFLLEPYNPDVHGYVELGQC